MSEKPRCPVVPLGIDHVVLRCTRLDETLDFYRGVLGCDLRRVDEVNQIYQLGAGPDALIDLVPVGSKLGGGTAPAAPQFNVAHVCLRIAEPDWERIRDHLIRHGIPWQEPRSRFGAQGRGLSIYVTDPEGNDVELKADARQK